MDVNTLLGNDLKNLTKREKELFYQIIDEYKDNGNSVTYSSLLYDDYVEVPVDIITFIEDNNYLGKAWHLPDGSSKLYPYWKDKLRELFKDNLDNAYNNAIFSGARGLGKSEIAITCILYIMYRVMCLKKPHEYFNLKPTEKIAFAFMNITKALSEDIGISKFQNTVQMSPWFMERGSLTQRNNEPYWNPPSYIDIIIGSQASHVIGQPILACLDGETVVITATGEFKIKDLADKPVKVYNVDENNNIVLSNLCTAKITGYYTDEYEIQLEDGSIIRCTPNHKFMLIDGSYKEAQYLTESDELAEIKPFGYIYKFTDTKTNKVYIGKREKPEFDINYWGSGKNWKPIVESGKEFIKREVLEWCYSRTELNSAEIKWIKQFKSTDPEFGYNIHKGGQGGNSLNDYEKWSELHRGDKNGRYHVPVSIETRLKIGAANSNKKRTEDQKLRISNSLKGRKKPEGFGEKVSKAQKGRKKGELELQHLREGNKKAALKNKGKFIYNNGIKEIRLYPNDPVPDGYVKGRIKTNLKSNLPRDYHWYNNGVEAIYCKDCPEGFKPGRKLQ